MVVESNFLAGLFLPLNEICHTEICQGLIHPKQWFSILVQHSLPALLLPSLIILKMYFNNLTTTKDS